MEALRPNLHRAKIAIILTYIGIGMDAISVFSDYLEYNLLSTAASGGMISEEEAGMNDVRQLIISLLNGIIIITSLVYFIRWFRRAYFNLHLRVNTLQFGEGWAAGSWFVPILCWFRPYQIMKELYSETDNFISQRIPDYKFRTNTTILGIWWALWIISNFLGNFIFKMTFKDDSLDGMVTTSAASMVMSLLGLPLGLVTAKLIKDYSELEILLTEVKDEPLEDSVTKEVAEKPTE